MAAGSDVFSGVLKDVVDSLAGLSLQHQQFAPWTRVYSAYKAFFAKYDFVGSTPSLTFSQFNNLFKNFTQYREFVVAYNKHKAAQQHSNPAEGAKYPTFDLTICDLKTNYIDDINQRNDFTAAEKVQLFLNFSNLHVAVRNHEAVSLYLQAIRKILWADAALIKSPQGQKFLENYIDSFTYAERNPDIVFLAFDGLMKEENIENKAYLAVSILRWIKAQSQDVVTKNAKPFFELIRKLLIFAEPSMRFNDGDLKYIFEKLYSLSSALGLSPLRQKLYKDLNDMFGLRRDAIAGWLDSWKGMREALQTYEGADKTEIEEEWQWCSTLLFYYVPVSPVLNVINENNRLMGVLIKDILKPDVVIDLTGKIAGQFSEILGRFQQSTGHVRRLEEDLRNLKAEVAFLTERSRQLEADEKAVIQERDGLVDELGALTQQQSDLEKTIDAQRHLLKERTTALSEFKNRAQKVAEVAQERNEDLSEALGERQKLIEENADLMARVKEGGQRIAELEQEREALQEENTVARQKLEAFLQAYKALEVKTQSFPVASAGGQEVEEGGNEPSGSAAGTSSALAVYGSSSAASKAGVEDGAQRPSRLRMPSVKRRRDDFEFYASDAASDGEGAAASSASRKGVRGLVGLIPWSTWREPKRQRNGAESAAAGAAQSDEAERRSRVSESESFEDRFDSDWEPTSSRGTRGGRGRGGRGRGRGQRAVFPQGAVAGSPVAANGSFAGVFAEPSSAAASGPVASSSAAAPGQPESPYEWGM